MFLALFRSRTPQAPGALAKLGIRDRDAKRFPQDSPMNTLRTHQCKTEVIIIAAVVLSSLAGCGLLPHRAAVANTPVANTQAPAANTNVAAAPAATRRSASHAPARPSQTH